MILGRILGWAFLAGAVFAIAQEVWQSIRAGAYISVPLGQLWLQIHPQSFDAVREPLQALAPFALFWPAWIELGVIGVALLYLFRRRKTA